MGKVEGRWGRGGTMGKVGSRPGVETGVRDEKWQLIPGQHSASRSFSVS